MADSSAEQGLLWNGRTRGGELNSRMMGLFSQIGHPAVRDAAWEYMRFYDSEEATAIKVRVMVEGGLGRFVNPELLRRYGYAEIEKLSPPGWAETFELAIKSGRPEPYGKNSNFAYEMMSFPIHEVERMALRDQLPEDEEMRLDEIQEILAAANLRANEVMIGTISPRERTTRRLVAAIAIAVIAVTFGLVFKKIIKAFTPESAPGVKAKATWGFVKYRWAYFLLLPAALTVLFWQYLPLARGSIMAFQDYRLIGQSSWVWLDNFGDVMFSRFWWLSLWNSLRYSFLIMSMTFMPPIILAILLQEVPKGKILFRTLFYLPALLMVAGTSKSGVDTPDAELIPNFLLDDLALYRKDVEGFFNENLRQAQNAMGIVDPSFRHFAPPAKPNASLAAEWERFVSDTEMPPYYYEAAYVETPVSRNSQPINLRRFKSEVASQFGGLEDINRELGTEFVSMVYFRVFSRTFLSRMASPADSPFNLAYDRFKERLPRERVFFSSVETFYRTEFLQSQYTRDIDNYNQAHGTNYESWTQVRLPRRYPAEDRFTDSQRRDWESFTREILNLLWLRADADAADGYREYLKVKNLNNIRSLNNLHHRDYASFEEVPMPAVDGAPMLGGETADWDAYVRGWEDPETKETHQIPVGKISVHGVDFMFQDYLAERHGSIEELNITLGTAFADWNDILPPQRDYHYLHWFLPNRQSLRWEFATRNFAAVAEFVLLQGRALFNTFVFCALTIICSLIVNPLAAYALSRYKPPSSYKVLLFLMMTMAFPPMVTQIPNFLLLRELGLLNTFAALILPGMANGYSIFLLKGFFDSLPKELYESAEIDGAGEFCIFWQITMSLSTPILAVIALNAFNAAYGNFMMALLVCQDQRMWTLMPWLYQLQMGSGQGVIFASLVIAAIPTFLIFVFCQNIIMRGIVVPVEK